MGIAAGPPWVYRPEEALQNEQKRRSAADIAARTILGLRQTLGFDLRTALIQLAEDHKRPKPVVGRAHQRRDRGRVPEQIGTRSGVHLRIASWRIHAAVVERRLERGNEKIPFAVLRGEAIDHRPPARRT